MNSWTGLIVSLDLGLLAGLALGALVHAWWLQRKANDRLRLPARWPLSVRGLVSSTEDEVWKWLKTTFHDHHVMVKTPVLRFTTLIEKEKGNASAKADAKAKADNERWLDLLGGLYTTFTICTDEGQVVGCVDVPGKTPPSKTTREMKETLLCDCGIAYVVVNSGNLPEGSAMRAAFLGEIAVETPDHEVTRGGDTRFHADLQAFTKQPPKPPKPPPPKRKVQGF